MKEIKLETKIRIYSLAELPEEESRLMEAAIKATGQSYAPYSKFHVGAAALLEDGTIITGSNQENAAYPSALSYLFFHIPAIRSDSSVSLSSPRYTQNFITPLCASAFCYIFPF